MPQQTEFVTRQWLNFTYQWVGYDFTSQNFYHSSAWKKDEKALVGKLCYVTKKWQNVVYMLQCWIKWTTLNNGWLLYNHHVLPQSEHILLCDIFKGNIIDCSSTEWKVLWINTDNVEMEQGCLRVRGSQQLCLQTLGPIWKVISPYYRAHLAFQKKKSLSLSLCSGIPEHNTKKGNIFSLPWLEIEKCEYKNTQTLCGNSEKFN